MEWGSLAPFLHRARPKMEFARRAPIKDFGDVA
jgi:hypothetical protein